MDQVTNKELALQLIGAGYKIIPCYPRGHEKQKSPMVPHGKDDASKLEGVILRWFGSPHVDKLIGIPCKANGFFAVDVDTPEAAATWNEWTKEFGMAEPGPMQRTTHGAHYLFKFPDFDFSGAVGKLAPGMDLRADNYICTGGEGSGYEWIVPITEPLTEAPHWLLDKIKAVASKTTAERTAPTNEPLLNPGYAAAYWLNNYTQKATIGTRNQNAYLMGLQLYYAGIPLADALNLWSEWERHIPQTRENQFTQSEYTRTIKSAYSTAPREAATLPREVRQAEKVDSFDTTKKAPEPTKAPEKPTQKAAAETPPEPKKAPKNEGKDKTDIKTPIEPKVEEAEPNKPRARYTVRGPDFYLAEREPIPYIVKDLVLEGSVNLWYGQFGSKKTWSLMDLAVCIPSGKNWLGFEVTPCNVLIIDEESGERRLADRIGSIIRGELAPEDVPVYSVSLAQFNLRNNSKDIDALTVLILETNAKLVIVDALADVMLGGDENAVKDTQPVFAALRYVSELTGAAFIVIHHSNKLGGYRGSSAIAGAIDSMVLIQSKPESDLVTFKTEKVRDGKPMTFAGSAYWTEYGFYMKPANYTASEMLTKAQRFTLDYFTEYGNKTLANLSDHAAELYAYETLKKAIQVLVNQGLLSRKDDGGRRVEATYGLTEKANG